MTAVQIIEQIKRLPASERADVEEFVVTRSREARQLSADELGKLAQHMVDSEDPDEQASLRAEIVRGFYGD